MEVVITRRLFSAGLVSALAAPAIVRPGVLMPVKRPTIRQVMLREAYAGRVWTVYRDAPDTIYHAIMEDNEPLPVRGVSDYEQYSIPMGQWRDAVRAGLSVDFHA